MSALVSVIIPSYNNARYLGETLESVLGQTYRPLEVVVVDDASTDDTPRVLASYAEHVRAIRLEKNSGGPARPRNAAIHLAQGGYLAMFDSDDLMHPDKLARQIAFLDEHPGVSLVFSDFENFSDQGFSQRFLRSGHDDFQNMPKATLGAERYRIASSDAYDTLLADNFVGTSGIVMRRAVVEAIGGFDESHWYSDDVEFLLRVSRGFDFGYLDVVLHRRRIHANSLSARPSALRCQERLYERIHAARESLSQRARENLAKKLSDTYFSRGYSERLGGNRKAAIQYYLKSWSLQRTRTFGIAKSVLRALLPL